MNLKQAIKLAILSISTEVYFLFLSPKLAIQSPLSIYDKQDTVKIKTSNPGFFFFRRRLTGHSRRHFSCEIL